jgi:hypothetical protein
MPQEQSKKEPGKVEETASELFKGFIQNIFGGQQASAAPQVDQRGAQTASVVGGLPPQLTPPLRVGQVPPAVVPPPAAPAQPTRGIAPAGTTFGNRAAAREAAGASFGDAVVQAIQSSQAKREADNVAKAQNTMNMFMNALAQGDMQVANLLAQDPKVTKSWEKYLKMEFPRMPGKAEDAGRPKPSPLIPGTTMAQPQPPEGYVPGVNQPGGIAIPRDMTPEAQIRDQQLQAVQQVMSRMSPEQIASTVPGMAEARPELSPAEFKQASLIRYGVAMSKEQEASLDAASRMKLAEFQVDMLKFLTGQEAQTDRALAVAGLYSGATVEAARIAAESRLQVARARIDAMKDLQNQKGAQLQTTLYRQNMADYGAMARELQRQLADESMTNIWRRVPEARRLKEQERDMWLQKEEAVRREYEGFLLMQKLMPDMFEIPEGDDNISITPPSPEAQ